MWRETASIKEQLLGKKVLFWFLLVCSIQEFQPYLLNKRYTLRQREMIVWNFYHFTAGTNLVDIATFLFVSINVYAAIPFVNV